MGGELENSKHQLVIDSTSDGGAKWRAGSLHPLETFGQVSGVSCVGTKSTCFAVGQAAEPDPVQIWKAVNGLPSWAAAGWPYGDAPAEIGILDALDCPSSSICYAVGQASTGLTATVFRTTDGGASWLAATVASSVANLDAVSCARPTVCTAVGTTAHDKTAVIVTKDGQHWSSP